MKQLTYKIFTLLFLACLVSSSVVNAEEVTKQISKSFNIKSETRIKVSNKYGDVIIKRWDKNVVDLRVEIEVNGKSESKTQKILDAIEIDISDRISSGSLSFSTEIGKINGNSSFSINYEITMPNTNEFSLSNSFGSIYLGSYKGDLDIDLKYGQLIAEDLEKADINISFSNGMCEIESLKSGSLDLRYSKMEIGNLGNIDISSQFSELEIENAGVVELNGRYGNFKIDNIKSLDGDIQFSGLDIDNIEESIFLKTRHGGEIKIENISIKFKELDIESQFSTINIGVEKGLSATLEFNLEFGNLRAHGEGINFSKVIKENNSSEYRGYLGNENATSSIKVSTRHGNIRLTVD